MDGHGTGRGQRWKRRWCTLYANRIVVSRDSSCLSEEDQQARGSKQDPLTSTWILSDSRFVRFDYKTRVIKLQLGNDLASRELQLRCDSEELGVEWYGKVHNVARQLATDCS